MSSLAAVLASPASGVSEAVTGYPIGRGDGVNSVFTVPPEITAVSTLYRRDWRGTVALSPSARTNLLSYSQDFTNAAWYNVNVSIGASVVAPDGSLTAISLVEANNNNYHCLNRASGTTGIQQVFSVYAKAGIRKHLILQLGQIATIYDLSNGTVVSESGVSIVSIGDGWYRCITTRVPTNQYTVIYVSKDGAATYQGDGVSGIYIWGSQLENGSSPSPYIPTTTAPVTVTDYTLSGSTLTLAEVPARAAELTVDGTGVGIPMLRIA